MIKQIGDRFFLLSENGREKLGEFTTRAEAEEKEAEIIKNKRKKALESYKSDRDKENII